MTSVRAFTFLLGFATLMLLFQNCGHIDSDESGVVRTSGSGCTIGPDAIETFNRSFYPLFSSISCQNCHKSSGVMFSTPLADPVPLVALNAFAKVGPKGIEKKLSAGHNGVNWDEVKPAFDDANTIWEEEIGSCSESGLSSQSIVVFQEDEDQSPDGSGAQYLNRDYYEPVYLSWNLSKQPYLAEGVEFNMELSVKLAPDAADPTRHKILGYRVGRLQLKTNGVPYQVGAIQLYLNDVAVNVADFSQINTVVTSGEGDLASYEDIEGGGALMLITKSRGNFYSNEDRWSVSFGLLKAVEE